MPSPPQSDPIKTSDIKVKTPPQSPSRITSFFKLILLLILLPITLVFATIIHSLVALLLLIPLIISKILCNKTSSEKFAFYISLVSESLTLNYMMSAMLLRYNLDGLTSPSPSPSPSPSTQAGDVPSCAYMSRITGIKDVVGVENNAPLTEGGAGGHGTERNWFTLQRSSPNEGEGGEGGEGGGEGKDNVAYVFMKSRTKNFSESFFLNVFGVYSNEIAFYKELKKEAFVNTSTNRATNKVKVNEVSDAFHSLPSQFFPKVYLSDESTFGSDFKLILEDVVASRQSDTRRITFPNLSPEQVHDKQRVEQVLITQANLHAAFYLRPPATIWRSSRPASSPPFLQIVSSATLRDVEKRFAGVMSEDVLSTYRLFLKHYDVVRRYMDKSGTTMVHGDAHIGNYFFDETLTANNEVVELKARMYDFQCVAVEHPMRDVVYHVMSSVSAEVVSELGGDEAIVKSYLTNFNANLNGRCEQLTFEKAMFNYRLNGCWVLAAWIISAGAGEELFEGDKARFILGRISGACERVHVRGALEVVLKEAGAI